MNAPLPAVVDDEIVVLESLLPLADARVIELGCGAAKLARTLLERHPQARVTGLEVDERQHAKNLAAPSERLQFVAAGAQSIPFPDASFDIALMLKSLHHVPRDEMSRALAEIARVLRPGGWLYASEPVYAGPFNDIVKLFNDEGEVRALAQRALDEAVRAGGWREVASVRFDMPVAFRDFEEFDQRMMRPTFADHRIDEAKRARVREAFEHRAGPDGLRLLRPMHVRLLQRA
jgi:SAM-dependent methyltransferase